MNRVLINIQTYRLVNETYDAFTFVTFCLPFQILNETCNCIQRFRLQGNFFVEGYFDFGGNFERKSSQQSLLFYLFT